MLKLQAKGVAIWADEHHWTAHCVRSSEWSTFHLHLCIIIIPMYLRLTTFTKTLPQMSFHLYFFAIFISLWGSTHDSWAAAVTHYVKRRQHHPRTECLGGVTTNAWTVKDLHPTLYLVILVSMARPAIDLVHPGLPLAAIASLAFYRCLS